jgi:hypothetical protein
MPVSRMAVGLAAMYSDRCLLRDPNADSRRRALGRLLVERGSVSVFVWEPAQSVLLVAGHECHLTFQSVPASCMETECVSV